MLDIYTFGLLIFIMPVLSVLFIDYTMVYEILEFLYRLFPFIVGFVLLFGLSWREFVKINENGVQVGHKMLGIPVRGVYWPFEFFNTFRITETKWVYRIYYQVVIDFFIGEKKVTAFKSKEEAEQFQAYLGHVCSIYENG